MSAPIASNMRATTVQNILGQAAQVGRSAASYASSSVASVGSSFTPENGSYLLSILFYVFLYGFIAFLILLVIHFTMTPIFRFNAGDKGLIGVPASQSDKVYWTDRTQPPPESRAPFDSDSLAQYEFENNFSFSIDLYCTKITSTNVKNRLILFKTYKYGVGQPGDFNAGSLSPSNIDQICAARSAEGQSGYNPNQANLITNSPLATPPGTNDTDLESYMKGKCSMFMYLTDTNDLIITFFVGTQGTPYSCKPIRNIPLYTPFRVSCVAEKKLFTVYLNGKQTFQKIVPVGISLNSFNALRQAQQRFYTAPSWANSPVQTVFIQNLHIWPHTLNYPQVSQAMPALASVKDFNATSDEDSNGQCS
jgi:hypothetical protein